jgi:hypothetical protein
LLRAAQEEVESASRDTEPAPQAKGRDARPPTGAPEQDEIPF